MARRTKEDAAETRSRLLGAAERLFSEKGVSRTSLNDIAIAAGTTRGAIYWHFKDKADLFNAMMERVTLPLESALSRVDTHHSTDPLDDITAAMRNALYLTANDAQVRRVFEVATLKVEYVDDLLAVKQRHLDVRNKCLLHLQGVLARASQHYGVVLPLPVDMAAQGLHAIVSGLLQNWLLDPAAFDLVATGQAVMDAYLAGLGFPQRSTNVLGQQALQ
ncbi:MAG: TetR family transcriptional regulator [Xylophilus sp.]|nr:TetR family transcriptional regulator [Xylophilus sp.]MBP7420207.1 TetR family transcriptional regulator [Burkholderiaceae bacterium]MBP8229440.1 TetR family transcriptional regulator [Xylophilus sp.]